MVSVIVLPFLASALAAAAPPAGLAERSTRAAIARIERDNTRLHAVIAVSPDAVAEARAIDRAKDARGPLFGRPILIKDNIETRDQPTTAGSLALAANDTKRDAPLVAGLRAAGAVILGKTNLSEWANFRGNHSMSGWSAVGGQTHNPHDPARSPGGSSSGSAVAVAAGMVDIAIGTDTGGSITGPASLNGIVGLRPTVGRVSRNRIIPIADSQDTPGPLARSVRDAAIALGAMAAPDPADPATAAAPRESDFTSQLRTDALRGVRIGVLRFDTKMLPAVDLLFERALGVLRAQGATLVDIEASGADASLAGDQWLVMKTEFKAGVNAYLRDAAPAVSTRSLADLIAFDENHAAQELVLFGQETFVDAERAPGLDDQTYRAALARARQNAGPRGIDRLLRTSRTEVLVSPTRLPAFLIDTVNGDLKPPSPSSANLAAMAGYPHLTVPMGLVKGLPVGLSFIGTAWSEARLLAFGFAFEQARGAIIARR